MTNVATTINSSMFPHVLPNASTPYGMSVQRYDEPTRRTYLSPPRQCALRPLSFDRSTVCCVHSYLASVYTQNTCVQVRPRASPRMFYLDVLSPATVAATIPGDHGLFRISVP